MVLGSGNEVDGYTSSPAGTSTTIYRGVVAGNTNLVGSGSSSGFSGVFGSANTANIVSSLVAGNQNVLGNNANSFGTCVRYSGVFGMSNVVPQNRYSLLISGGSNSVDAYESLVAGNGNTVNAGTVGWPAYQSTAIGQLNNVNATHGYAIGYWNTVSGDRGVAIGSGTKASNVDSTALGRYNAPMSTGDVLVVGTGTADTARSTALRVTSDGGVILGRAQGDISMGDFQ